MKIAVIIPSLGRAFLDETIQSLRGQTRRPDEVIILFDNHQERQYALLNRAIQQSYCDAFIPLSDDDKLLPTFIEETEKAIGEADIVYTDLEQSDGTVHKPRHPFFTALCRKRTWVDVGGYDETIGDYADWDFWWMCDEHAARKVYLPKPLFWYRLHPDQGVAKITNEAEQKAKIMQKHS